MRNYGVFLLRFSSDLAQESKGLTNGFSTFFYSADNVSGLPSKK